MKFFSEETQYVIRETIRRVGITNILKFVVILSFIFWLLWPEDQLQKQHNTQSTQKENAVEEPAVPTSQPTAQDLRPLMTSSQSSYYWKSFIWMMEHGKDLTPRSFGIDTFFARYIKDAPFKGENGLNCHPYSEIIMMAGKSNARRGIACHIAAGSWCRQPEGERAECRHVTANGGLETISNDYSIEMHNLKLEWNNKLSQFGF